jgi:phosphopantetheinyl transferase
MDGDRKATLFARCLRDYSRAGGRPGAADDVPLRPGIGRGPHGKPYFAEPPLAGKVHFSVSHSGRYWAALFAGTEVGLDIEDLSIHRSLTQERMKGIAERFFSADERAHLVAAGIGREAFFRIWTAKEAYAKYTGKGMAEGFATFSALAAPHGLTIATAAPAAGLICSCCHRGDKEGHCEAVRL